MIQQWYWYYQIRYSQSFIWNYPRIVIPILKRQRTWVYRNGDWCWASICRVGISVITLQRNFLTRFHKDPPDPKTIGRLVTTGCLCKGISSGPPCVPQETVQRVRACFESEWPLLFSWTHCVRAFLSGHVRIVADTTAGDWFYLSTKWRSTTMYGNTRTTGCQTDGLVVRALSICSYCLGLHVPLT